MSMSEKVKNLIAQQLNKSVDEIADEKEIVKDLGADSLDVVEMLMTMEEEFGITVPEDQVANVKTVKELTNSNELLKKGLVELGKGQVENMGATLASPYTAAAVTGAAATMYVSDYSTKNKKRR